MTDIVDRLQQHRWSCDGAPGHLANSYVQEAAVEIERLRGEQSTCEKYRHVFLFADRGAPCPHCIIEKLLRLNEELIAEQITASESSAKETSE